MAKYNDKTARGWPLPNKNNRLYDDVERLREAITLIDETITGVETREGAIEDRQDFLSTRLDTVIEGATEDTEILNARVDAEGNVHPNLGHNIRNIHGGLLQAVSDIKYGVQEFQGLLHQFSAIAEAQIQDELNVQEANERRKAELAQEALVRLLQDDDFQQQINEVSEATMRTAATLRELSERRRAKLNHEESERISSDDSLQREINALAEAFLNDASTLSESLKHRRDALKREIEARIAGDAALQERIQQELEQRTEHDTAIHETLDLHDEAINLHKEEIESEIQARTEGDKGLACQADANAEANLHTALNVQDLNARRKADLLHEEQERIARDANLQSQADSNATANLELAASFSHEAEERRKVSEALNAEIQQRTEHDTQQDVEISRHEQELLQERQIRSEQDDGLQKQINDAAEAILWTSVNLRELSERRKAALTREESERISSDDNLQREINVLSEAFLRDSVNLYEALERRKEALKQEIQARVAGDTALREQISRNAEKIQQETDQRAEHDEAIHEELASLNEEVALRKSEIDAEVHARVEGDEGLARQANANAEATLRTNLTVQKLNARRKAELLREEQARIARDEDLQRQIDKTAEASLENSLGIQQEARQRRKSDERIEALTEETSRQSDIDAYHQRQIDAAVLAILQNTLTLSETLALRREALLREEHSRYEEDANQQAQIDTNAFVNMRNSLNIQQEAEQRRKVLDRLNELRQETQQQIQTLRNEMGLLYEIPLPGLYEQLSGLQVQANQNAEAGIRNILNLSREAESRRELTESLNEADAYHQRQIDALISAILENSVNLHSEVARRVEAIRQERFSRFEEDTALRDEINTVAEAVMRNMLALNGALSHQRDMLTKEAQARVDEDIHLQRQADTNAIATIELVANLSSEAEKRRALGQAIAGIKSPVDWSKAESLAIPEPRCAVVNFTGLASMPTSKTVDIPAVIEFWDLQGNYFKKNILCAAQGSSSLGYVKKNVKVDLLNEDGSEFDLKIGNWVAQDGFHLKAYYTDFFRGVGVTSYKFWDEVMRYNGLDKDRPYKRAMIDAAEIQTSGTSLNNPDDMTLQLDTGALCHPDAFPCIVYLNGTFYGVFSWQIKKQRKNYHMDKSTIEHIHLDGTLSTANFWNGTINWTAFEIRNPNKLYTMDGKKYDGDAPKELIDETSEKYDPDNKDHVRSAKVKKYIRDFVESFGVLKQLYTAYRSNPSDETLAAVKAKYEELFDWENQRDYLIFSDIIKNSDGFGKNWQWTTYDGVKWYVNAYDLDMSYGGHWQGTQITPPLTGHITTSTALPTYYVALFYKSELESRYRELRDAGIISVNNILSKLADWTARVGVGNYELEYERWPNSPCILNYTDSIYRVKRWLEVEIANMDRVYRYSPDAEHEPVIDDSDNSEVQVRAEQDAGVLRQIALLAEADMRNELNHALLNAERRREEAQEREIRDEQDAGLQAQMNQLAVANMWLAVRGHETRKKINEVSKSISGSSGIASDSEVDEMLDEIYNG